MLSSARDAVDRRANIAVALTVALLLATLAIVLVRVVQLQAFTPDHLAAHIQARRSVIPLTAPRADILDRRGRVIATSAWGQRLILDPYTFADLDLEDEDRDTATLRERINTLVGASDRALREDPADTAEKIATALQRTRLRLAEDRTPLRYVPLSDVLDGTALASARTLDVRGVFLERVPVRKVADPVALALVGKVGVENTGLVGTEYAFDERLQAEPGSFRFVRDAWGDALWIEPRGYDQPEPGEPLRLSIDLVIQSIAQEEIERGVAAAGAIGGRLIAINPATGEVLAMVDHVVPEEQWEGMGIVPFTQDRARDLIRNGGPLPRFQTLQSDPARAEHPARGRNRIVEDVYEPGSTFKAMMWAGAIDEGIVTRDEMIPVFGGRRTTDYGRQIIDVVTAFDELTWDDVLVYSSNVGMTQVIERLSYPATQRIVERFGFGSKTHIGLPGESAGLVTPPQRWHKYTQTSLALGYEIAVTPVQMVRAFSAFAREGDRAGTLPTLRLTSPEYNSEEIVVRERVLEPDTARAARDVMVEVADRMVELADRQYPDDPPLSYTLFGKSGTAEIPAPRPLGYFDNQYNSSFVAAAPLENPRIAVLVVIDDPSPQRVRDDQAYGSWVAGPVVKRFTERSLAYLGVEPDRADEDGESTP